MPVEVRVAAVLCCLVLAGCPGGGGGGDDGGVDEDSFAGFGGEGGEGGAGSAGSAGSSGSGAGGYAGAPMKSGGCTNTCSDANDGYCDDGGPNADYDFCKLGTDCADCGARGALDSVDEEPAAYSTLCSAVSSTAAGESLSLNCADESVSAATACCASTASAKCGSRR